MFGVRRLLANEVRRMRTLQRNLQFPQHARWEHGLNGSRLSPVDMRSEKLSDTAVSAHMNFGKRGVGRQEHCRQSLRFYDSQRLRGSQVHRQSDRSWRPPPARNGSQAKTWEGSSLGIKSTGYSRARTFDTHSSTMPGRLNQTGNANNNAGHPLSAGGILLSYQDLERALEKRGLNAVRVLFGAAAAFTVALGLMWPRIKKWGAVEGAEVAAASLQQEELKLHAAALVNALLSEPGTAKQMEKLLKDAVLGLFQDDQVKTRATEWTSALLADAVLYPAVIQRGTDYVQKVLSDESSREAGHEYVSQAAQRAAYDAEVQNAASQVSVSATVAVAF